MICSVSELQSPELLALCQAAWCFDPVDESLLSEKVWADPDFEAELCLWYPGRAFAMAVVRPGREWAYLKLLAVAPEFRRQGLASELLRELEQRLAGRGLTRLRVCESHPNYLQPGVDVRYTAGLLFFERHGFQRLGETFNLCCELSGREFKAAVSEPLSVRRAAQADRPAVLRFLAEHFPTWRAEVEMMFGRQPVSLHLGWEGEQLLGFAGYDGNNLGTGWFGPMGTGPAARGRGLGAALLAACLRDFQAQGLARCVIPWVGPYGFYSQHCGAYIERVFWRFEKQLTLLPEP